MARALAFIKPILAISASLVGGGGLVTLFLLRSEPHIKPHSRVMGLDLGGLTIPDARKKVRIWWDSRRTDPIKLAFEKEPGTKIDLQPQSASQLGVLIDDEATVAQMPTDNALSGAARLVHAEDTSDKDFPVILKPVKTDLTGIQKEINQALGPFRPARVVWAEGQLIKKNESLSMELDRSKLLPALTELVNSKAKEDSILLPVQTAKKRISDEDLASITDLVSSYTTHFPRYQYNRNNNIKVASGKLNGVILLPGESLSFNKTVGERTVKSGFQEAGIYKNGKHDKGIGGGICQVSSTLYNAALLGDFKILRHHNHSMPVAYVPIGRDATVNYGVIDLVIENNYETPIAVTSEFIPGSLTFRIFGKAKPDLKVEIERTGFQDWDQSIKYQQNPHLKPGQQVVVEKGSRGHRVKVYRLVYYGDALQRKEYLGQSYYAPSPKLIARGPGYYPADPVTGNHRPE